MGRRLPAGHASSRNGPSSVVESGPDVFWPASGLGLAWLLLARGPRLALGVRAAGRGHGPGPGHRPAGDGLGAAADTGAPRPGPARAVAGPPVSCRGDRRRRPAARAHDHRRPARLRTLRDPGVPGHRSARGRRSRRLLRRLGPVGLDDLGGPQLRVDDPGRRDDPARGPAAATHGRRRAPPDSARAGTAPADRPRARRRDDRLRRPHLRRLRHRGRTADLVRDHLDHGLDRPPLHPGGGRLATRC